MRVRNAKWLSLEVPLMSDSLLSSILRECTDHDAAPTQGVEEYQRLVLMALRQRERANNEGPAAVDIESFLS